MASGYSIPTSLLPYLTGSLKDNSSNQASIVKVNYIFLPLITLSVGSRLYVRFRMLGAAGLDDILMGFALLFAALLSTFCLVGEHFGLGKHLWNLSTDLFDLPADTARVTKMLFGCYLSYSSAISFTKFSIMATYIRIFPKGGRLRRSVFVIGIVVLCFWFSSIFAIIFSCVPVQASWDYTIPRKHCYTVVNYFYVSASFNIATDLLLCLLPMPTFWALSMPKSQRVILCVLFSTGLFACVASTIRFTTLHRLTGADITYQSGWSLNWSVIEVGTAIMTASVPSLRPLATKYFPRFFETSPSPSGGTSRATKKSEYSGLNFKSTSSQPASRTDSVHVHVQQTFSVMELTKLPAKPSKTWIKSGETLAGRTILEDNSSEDLVQRT